MLELDSHIEIAGEAGDGQGAINLARKLHPDVILMDLKMHGTSGLEASRVIHKEMPDVKIIVLTIAADDEMLEVIRTGVSGYLLKDVKPAELLQAIYDVLEGKSAFHPLSRKNCLVNITDSTRPLQKKGLSLLQKGKKRFCP